MSHDLGFAKRVLCRWRVKSPRPAIRRSRAIPQGPDARPSLQLEGFGHEQTAALLSTRKCLQQRIRRSAGRPNERICVNFRSVAQSHDPAGKFFNLCVQANFDFAAREFLLSVDAQLLAQFRQNDRAGMNEDNSKHVLC